MDSRRAVGHWRRRRICNGCGERITTYEITEVQLRQRKLDLATIDRVRRALAPLVDALDLLADGHEDDGE